MTIIARHYTFKSTRRCATVPVVLAVLVILYCEFECVGTATFPLPIKILTSLLDSAIHGWVIDDLAHFACNFRGWVRTDRASSWVRGPNFTKLGQNIGRSSQHCTFVSELAYLATFSNAGGSKLSDVLNDAKFRTFSPLWKLGEGWARSLYQLLKLYLGPNLRNTCDGRPLRG